MWESKTLKWRVLARQSLTVEGVQGLFSMSEKKKEKENSKFAAEQQMWPITEAIKGNMWNLFKFTPKNMFA